jgi:hypothetical protein
MPAKGRHAAVEERRQMNGETRATHEDKQWRTVARIRAKSSDWVVIWIARKDEFQARPLFRAPKDTVAVGASPEELAQRMLAIEQRCGKQPREREAPAEPAAGKTSD